MLISPDYHFAISNLGWVDRGSLWIYDARKDEAFSSALGDARYLSLFPCGDAQFFAVLHHFDGPRIRLTVHSFEDPSRPAFSLEQSRDQCRVDGDPTALANAPRYYTAYYDPGSSPNYYLLRIDPADPKFMAEPFDWFDASYDKDYQGIVGVIELPSGSLVISVQRDSHPVVYDPLNKKVTGKLSLANRAGNPRLRLSRTGRELWADDYDTLLKLNPTTLKVIASKRLQGIGSPLAAQFIGDWCLDPDESLCYVARPFSGDVLAISTDNLRIRFAAKTGKQPLDAACLGGGMVVARDWKSGSLLKGKLTRVWLG